MYLAVLLAFLSISCRASFVGHSPPNSPLTGRHALGESIEYIGSGESSKEPVLESIVTKRGVDPLSIPQLIREPPLKRGDKRDSYVYPSTSSKLSDRVPLREPPLKRQEYFELSNLFSPSEKIMEWQDTTDEKSGEDFRDENANIFVLPSSKQSSWHYRENLDEPPMKRRSSIVPLSFLSFPSRQMRSFSNSKPLSLTKLWR